jgi:hypothetical protein
MPVLTFIDAIGIQSFVFLSNKLRDAVAGSEMISEVLGNSSRNSTLGVIANGLGGETIMAAGGNALVRFDDMASAREFAARCSRALLEKAPGLDVVISHCGYNSGDLAKAIRDVHRGIQKAKFERVPSACLPALSVIAECSKTRLPATAVIRQPGDEPPVPLSDPIASRRLVLKQSSDTVCPGFTEGGGPGVDLCYPLDIDNMGRTRADTSLLGVVHVDGNKVGSRLADWLKEQSKNGAPDEQVEDGYKKVSQAIDEMAHGCLAHIRERIIGAVRWQSSSSSEDAPTGNQGNNAGDYVLYSVPLNRGFALKRVREKDRDIVYLPIRPIIVGGDDITFVCDGRIALDLAETALRYFMQAKICGLGQVTASTGVAIGKSHTPFARLYDTAAALCKSAKRYLHKENINDSCMDWHIGTAGVTDVEAQRERSYTTPDRKYHLTCRPYPLGSSPDEPETWTWLNETILGIKQADNNRGHGLLKDSWQRHRTKINSLRSALVYGPDSVERAIESWSILAEVPLLPGGDVLAKCGYLGRRTPFLDAIELMDIHFPLGKG